MNLAVNTWVHDRHKVLGLFLPLIVTNCAILGRAESFASRNRVLPALFDGLVMGVGFSLSLVAPGAVREVLGSGTLFRGAALMLGGFVALGFVLPGKRVLDRRFARRRRYAAAEEVVA